MTTISICQKCGKEFDCPYRYGCVYCSEKCFDEAKDWQNESYTKYGYKIGDSVRHEGKRTIMDGKIVEINKYMSNIFLIDFHGRKIWMASSEIKLIKSNKT